ncbi:MAG TPA: hypothetical protein VFW28_17255 [Micropepsaceae bacterium]|nr:hypothetical protein [Micropepsaceae bacterium]
MRNNIGLVLAAAGLALFGFTPAARAQANLCAMLPGADVSSVVGSPVKLDGGSKPETNKSGTGTLTSQSCTYDPPGGIGSGPATVRVNITQASSVPLGAQMFKAQMQFNPVGKGDPVSGVGDEAQSFRAAGSIYMRKKNILADIHVGLRDLNTDRELAMGKALAVKIAARVQ